MRKQYHFRPSADGLQAWDVDRLIDLSARLPIEAVSVTDLRDVDRNYWFSHGHEPSVRAVVEHLRLVNEADLSYPIIIDPEGGVMDGMHRVAKALLAGHPTVSARRLLELPPPDYIDVQPDALPYPT